MNDWATTHWGHSALTEYIWFQNSWHQYINWSTLRSTSFVLFPLRKGSTSMATFSAHSLRRTLPMLASKNAFPYHAIHNSMVLVKIVFPRNSVWWAAKAISNYYLNVGNYPHDGVPSTSREASSCTCSIKTFPATAIDINCVEVVFSFRWLSKSFIQSRKFRVLNVCPGFRLSPVRILK